MKKEIKEENILYVLCRILFFILIFIVSIDIFKYFQKKLMYYYYEGIAMPDIKDMSVYLSVIYNWIMILLFFIMIISTSIFNLVTRKKNNSSIGKILLLIEILIILILNFIMYYKGFYAINISVEKYGTFIKIYDSYMDYFIFFIGETITFFSILMEIFLELIEKEYIQKGINYLIFILLLVFYLFTLAVEVTLLFKMVSSCVVLTVILVFLMRESKPIRLFGVMICFMTFIITLSYLLHAHFNMDNKIFPNEIIVGMYIVIMGILIAKEAIRIKNNKEIKKEN